MKFVYVAPLAMIASGIAYGAERDVISQAPNGDIVFRDYPARAEAAGEQGKVGFRIKTDANGFPVECIVTRSSGHPKLDQETCQLLTVHGKFAPVQGSNGLTVLNDGVVSWKMPTHAVLQPSERLKPRPMPKWNTSRNRLPDSVEVKVAEADGGKQICKRVPRTGSLAGFERICRTAKDWAKTNEANGFWADKQGRQGSTY